MDQPKDNCSFNQLLVLLLVDQVYTSDFIKQLKRQLIGPLVGLYQAVGSSSELLVPLILWVVVSDSLIGFTKYGHNFLSLKSN